MKYNPEGVQNLVNAIYKQAANDYMKALIMENERGIKEAETFLLSGAYLQDEDRKGAYLVERCREEVKIAEKFIIDFLKSDSKEIEVDTSAISANVLRIAVYNCYKTCSTRTKKDDKLYLIKKPKRTKKPLKMA